MKLFKLVLGKCKVKSQELAITNLWHLYLSNSSRVFVFEHPVESVPNKVSGSHLVLKTNVFAYCYEMLVL